MIHSLHSNNIAAMGDSHANGSASIVFTPHASANASGRLTQGSLATQTPLQAAQNPRPAPKASLANEPFLTRRK